jgi:hypothetical protein
MVTTVEFFQQAVDWLAADPAHVVVAASAVVAVTGTPDPNTWYGKVYMVLEAVALNVLKAKQIGGDYPSGLPGAVVSQMAAAPTVFTPVPAAGVSAVPADPISQANGGVR